MIVHLATYPRSGNSLLKQLVWSFHYLTISPRAHPDLANVIAGILELLPHCTMSPTPAPRSEAERELLWDDRTATYQWPSEPSHRYVLLNSNEAHSPDIRRALAAEDEFFFIKTHDLPIGEYPVSLYFSTCVIRRSTLVVFPLSGRLHLSETQTEQAF